jgi:hypothetical protein
VNNPRSSGAVYPLTRSVARVYDTATGATLFYAER